MLDLTGKSGGIYKRASKDTAAGTVAEGLSVDGQEEEARARAAELSIKIVDVYDDNNLSASKYATKEREDWPRMLDDIRSGKLEVLILWDTSRGSRELTEWSLFLDLIAKHQVPLHVVSHDRTYNPNNHRDWETLAMDGVKSAAFSNQLSANLRRGQASARRKGRPHGVPPFGWRRVYDEKTGKMIGQVPRSDEQPFVEEAFKYVLSGGSMAQGAVDWAKRNNLPDDDPRHVPLTRGGRRWTYMVYRAMLLSPVHMGKFYDTKTKELCDGNWEGFIEEDVWWSVNNIIAAKRTPVGSRPAGAKHLLTFIARCGLCGSYMGSAGGKERRKALVCSALRDDGTAKFTQKHLSIRMDWADEDVTKELVKRLCDRDLVASLARMDTEAARAARAEAAKLQTQLDSIFEDVKNHRGPFTATQYAELAAAWEPDIARLQEQATTGLDAGAALALQFQQMADEAGVEGDELYQLLWEAFEDTPLGGQRVLVKTFTPSITIKQRKQRGGKARDPERVQIE